MGEYNCKATGLIVEEFTKAELKFQVDGDEERETILIGFPINCGPNVIVRYICTGNRNDVAARVFGLLTGIPEEKRNRVMQACNILSGKIRYLKFYLDRDGDVNVEYDFPELLPDSCVGKIAVESFRIFRIVLNMEYAIFPKALYTEEPLEKDTDGVEGLARELMELREALSHRGEGGFVDFLEELKGMLDDEGPDEDADGAAPVKAAEDELN